MNETETDLDRIAAVIESIVIGLASNTHAPMPEHGHSDSVTVTKNGWITTNVELARLAQWVKGLSKTHKASLTESD